MNFLPVLLMNIILVVITILLLIADRLLVSYGTCNITVEKDNEKQEFQVEGGQNLLGYLTDHGIEVSSSCGGKGSCGYCKVVVAEGGGPILPTEEIFMSRKEKERGMRLACQVKVKNDVRIVVPNYLEVVREMVQANKFDTSKRWLVTIK
ncbi:MAG TPA: 2Fe-2S iron-sulfur cluster binding domain-containing protein [Sediminispirochaeta sp.]|nr:2Fe-2S iron-sulfur cluster binding domain-containing protein [Sediminispirochaeta sp.]